MTGAEAVAAIRDAVNARIRGTTCLRHLPAILASYVTTASTAATAVIAHTAPDPTSAATGDTTAEG